MDKNQGNRILIFSVTYFPFIGGAEVAVREITDRIGDFDFDLITARLDRDMPVFEKMGSVAVYRVGLGFWGDKYLFPFWAYLKARRLHQKNNYRIVQSVMAFYAGLAAVFFKWTYPDVKYLLTMQSGDSEIFIWLRTWFWYPLYRKIYTKADYVQAISYFLSGRARRFGYKKDGEVVPNGVDADKFRMAGDRLRLTNNKRELGIRDDEKVIITVSRLVKKNGIDTLIKALNRVTMPCKLIVIGAGPDEKKLKRLARKFELESKILFLGQIDHSDLNEYFLIADAFVRLSRSEGFGNAFIEAMACGLPVIGTKAGGLSDYLKNERTGLVCRIDDVEDIANKINRLLSDEFARKKEVIIENSSRMVREKYNWNIISRQMKKIYCRLI